MSNLHSDQQDPYIHDPKNFAAASVGQAAWKDEKSLWTFERRDLLPTALDIVDNTAAPPTEVNGDVYIIDNTGASHAGWDGAAANSWVRFDGAAGLWKSIAPANGLLCYVVSYLKHWYYNGTTWASVDTGSLTFTGLSDTPASYSGQSLKVVRVNSGETGLEFATISGGTTTFTGLTDTPSSFTGAGLQGVRVNAGETALEFYTITDLNTNIANTDLTLTANRSHALAGFNLGFTGTGNFGIGTASPSWRLQVNNSVVSSGISVSKNDVGLSYLWYNAAGGSLSLTEPTGATNLIEFNGFGSVDRINTGKALIVNSATSSAFGKLRVNGTDANGGISASYNNTEVAFLWYNSVSGGALSLTDITGATNKVVFNGSTSAADWINTGKNFGIGTTTPTVKVDVLGSIRAYSGTFGGSTIEAKNTTDNSSVTLTNYGGIISTLSGAQNISLGAPVGGGNITNYINKNLHINISPSASYTNKGTVNIGTTGTAGASLTLVSSNATQAKIVLVGNETVIGTGGGSGIRLFDGSAVEKVRINAGGTVAYFGNNNSWFMDNLGVGVNAPTARLHVVGGDDFAANYAAKIGGATTNGLQVRNDGYIGAGNSTLESFTIGYGSGYGYGYNTFVGLNVGASNTTGAGYNTGFGYKAVFALTTGEENTAIGYLSSRDATIGKYNTSIGSQALLTLTQGNRNTAVGHLALSSVTTAQFNTAVGEQTLALNSASNNTAIGYASGYQSSGAECVFLGQKSGYYETGNAKLYIDNDTRANEADARAKSLIYGVFAAATANQRLTVNASLIGGSAALNTTATDGFWYVPSCAGTPTGVPTAFTGTVPMVADSTNNKLYIYSGGAWVALN